MDAVGVAWEATESPTLAVGACYRARFKSAALELPVGVHRLTFRPALDGRLVGQVAEQVVKVSDGENSFVMNYWPDLEPIGVTLVNPTALP